MKERIHVTLAFVAAALCEGGLWPLEPMTARALAAALLLLAGVLHAFSASGPGVRLLRVQVPAMLLGVALAASAPTASTSILGVALFAWALGAGRSAVAGPATGASAVALAVFAVLVEYRLVGPVRLAYESLAQGVCAASNTVTGGELSLGPTALGVDLAVLAFLLINAGRGWRGWRPRALRAAVSGLAVGLLLVGYAISFDAWIDATREFTRVASEEGRVVFLGLLPLFAALALMTALAPGKSGTAAPAPARVWAPVGACALLVALPLAVSGARRPAALQESTVLLIRTSSEDDRFEGSPRQSYGYYQSESYRAFRSWLSAWGCEVRYASAGELDSGDFEGVDLAVYVSPSIPEVAPRGDSQGGAVQEHLARGGSVLLIGDHTPSLASLASINAFLAPFDLRYEFDSVFPCRVGPGANLRAGAFPVRRGLAAAPESCYGVGASLRAGPAADVLVESRWAVGDLGFADSDALLGNRHYDHGDRLSDLPVVVSSSRGPGKVVVVGDTGSFVDSALPFSYPFVHAILEEALAPAGRGPWTRGAGILALLLLAGFAGRRAAWLPVAALVAGLTLADRATPATPAVPQDAERVVAIDLSLRSLTASLDRTRTSIKGFAYQCAVNGWLPMVVEDLATAVSARPDLIVLVSPALEADAALRSKVRDYVDGGGELWVAVGHEEAAGSRTLLSELGLGVLPRPFGSSLQLRGTSDVRYREGWEVAVRDGVSSEVLASVFGHPIVRRTARGRGHVTVFGDSYFLCDENVGTGEMTHEESASFLGNLLAGIQ